MKKSKLLKELVSPAGAMLVPHIDGYLARGKFPPTWNIEIVNYKPSDPHFHPSSHCFTEPKQLYRVMKGLEPREPIGASLRKTFDCGHMWHGYVGNILVEMGFVDPLNVEKHLVYETDNWIGSGTGDLVGVEIPAHGSWLVDMKTMNAEEFNAGPQDFTMKKWEAQVNCYGDWFGFDKMMILAIEKDRPHRFKEFVIQRNQSLLDEIYARWTIVGKALAEGVEPDAVTTHAD